MSNHPSSLIARAYELAGTGLFAQFSALEVRLNEEGRVGASLYTLPKAIRKDLLNTCARAHLRRFARSRRSDGLDTMERDMKSDGTHDVLIEVNAEAGHVIIDGPGGIALTFTPEAAYQTADEMKTNAVAAKSQNDIKASSEA